MLPFLKHKKDTGIAGIIIKKRNPDTQDTESTEETSSIDTCAQDLIDAVHAKDVAGVSEALKAAFKIMESEPHEEGEHTNKPSPHSYDAQNAAAASNKED